MDSSPTELWSEVRRLRREVANRVESLESERWESPSWCQGWRVRDVLAHLVHLAEATRFSMLRDLTRNGVRFDRATARIARRLGDEPVSALAQRLRAAADGRYHVLGSPAAVVLGEVVVHANDALRPLGLTIDATADDAGPVLDYYRRIAGLAFHSAIHRGVCLVATDLDWRSGQGPEVMGTAIDLLLLIANRRQVVASLHGPGVALLTA